MKKRIGLVISEIAQSYQKIIVNSVVNYANQNNYEVIVLSSYGSYNNDILYAEGEKAGIYLADFSRFDGLIVAEDVFDIPKMADKLYEQIRQTATCPVVYLRSTREGCYSVLVKNKEAMREITKHFIEDHGFTDICYMSGKKDAEDAKERLDGFLTEMKKHNLPVTEHDIFHGFYWKDHGKQAIDWFMTNRDKYPQAIICANDYMAISIFNELEARGVKIPNDVCVSGFDFVEEARYAKQSFTSFELDFDQFAKEAVNIIVKVNRNTTEVPKIKRVSGKLVLHSTCGCGCQVTHIHSNEYFEMDFNHINDTKNFILASTELQYAYKYNEYMKILKHYKYLFGPQKTYICYCEKDNFETVANNINFSDRMCLRTIMNEDGSIEHCNITFPRWKLLPDEYIEKDQLNNLVVFAIHYKNIMYGYIVTTIPPTSRWFNIYSQGYMMLLANAIENSELHNKMNHLVSIEELYKLDPLTNIFNRRGFNDILQEKYSLVTPDKGICLVSIDMDNLKVINDTYGHLEGDTALVNIAKALKNSLNDDEYCARTGGDEYAAVLNLTTPSRGIEFKKCFIQELANVNNHKNLYELSVSVGMCDSIDINATTLSDLIQIADNRMYAEKKTKPHRQ